MPSREDVVKQHSVTIDPDQLNGALMHVMREGGVVVETHSREHQRRRPFGSVHDYTFAKEGEVRRVLGGRLSVTTDVLLQAISVRVTDPTFHRLSDSLEARSYRDRTCLGYGMPVDTTAEELTHVVGEGGLLLLTPMTYTGEPGDKRVMVFGPNFLPPRQ